MYRIFHSEISAPDEYTPFRLSSNLIETEI
jgi:hypothetical protein